MQAAYFDKTGSLENLQLAERPRPQPGNGEVLVKVMAAALNPSDVKNVLGVMEGTTLPRVPGRDFAGVVESGPAEMIGREVWGSGGDVGFTRDGSHAEFIAVPANGVSLKPANLSMEQAAAAGVNYITAWLSLFDTAELQAGEAVLINGSSGAVGSAAVELARWKQARIFTLNRRATQQEGVEHALVAAAPEQYDAARQQVLEATGGRGVNVVFDTVGGALFEPCLRMLGQRGRQVNITSTGERRVSFDLIDFYHRRLRLYGVDSRGADTVASAAILRGLAPLFEGGTLAAPHVAERFPLHDVVKAYRAQHEGKLSGKAVLTPRTT